MTVLLCLYVEDLGERLEQNIEIEFAKVRRNPFLHLLDGKCIFSSLNLEGGGYE